MDTSDIFLLRIEGVNLSNAIFDTRDLSTIRGGSLMLLDAVRAAREALDRHGCNPATLSEGASVGLFQIRTNEPGAAAQVVRNALITGKFRHATFVVDIVSGSGDFRYNNEAVLAANRWRHMQASTLSVPATPDAAEAAMPPACDRDGLRPALKSKLGPKRDDGSPTFLSPATRVRRDSGRQAKHDFYEQQTGLNEIPDFAQDFESISMGLSPLEGKIAIFYADGNGFGKLQQKCCDTPIRQALWDHFIRKTRREFLIHFLVHELKTNGRWTDSKGRVRFETLLWGGDELMFVMPASLGWRFAGIFFDKLGERKITEASFPTKTAEENHPFADDPAKFSEPDILSHTAALVFCQHHAPIDRVKRLAKDGMTEFAKNQNRNRDQLLCVALESFDHLGISYETGMASRYNALVDIADMIIAARDGLPLSEVLKTIADSVGRLRSERSEFARGQLRALVNQMLARPNEAAAISSIKTENGQPRLPAAFRNVTDEDKQILVAGLRQLFSSEPILWLQLEELWDYAKS